MLTFSFEDITEEFLSQMVFYEFQRPNAHMDTAGWIEMFNKEGRMYRIFGEDFELPYRRWNEKFSVLDECWKDPNSLIGTNRPWDGEVHGNGRWVMTHYIGDCVLPEEFAAEFMARIRLIHELGGHPITDSIASKVLGVTLMTNANNTVFYESEKSRERIESKQKDGQK